MRYFYEYKEKSGVIVGGHNLEKINIKNGVIKLEGVDFIPTSDDMYEEHWTMLIDSKKLEYLKIIPMEDKEV